HEQHDREPDHDEAERQQGGVELGGDVDRDGGRAGHREGGSVAVRDRGGELADVLDEGGRLRVGGARRGDDLDDRRVDGFVRDGGSDGGDARHLGELVGDRVEVLEHLGRLGDVDRDDERAVAAGAEGVVDEVVGAPGGFLLGERAAVGQGERELGGGDRGDAEQADDGEDEHDGGLEHERDPALPERAAAGGGFGGGGIRGLVLVRVRAQRGARSGLGGESPLQQNEQGREQRDRGEHGEQHREGG